MADFLHERHDFDQLLAVVANERALDPMLVEKDYWIMHGLWGLQAQDFVFELKGRTSLSKGFGVIHRFSEDIGKTASCWNWGSTIPHPTDLSPSHLGL